MSPTVKGVGGGRPVAIPGSPASGYVAENSGASDVMRGRVPT